MLKMPVFMPAAETTDKVKMSFLQYLAEEDSARSAQYQSYRDYDDGEHNTQLTERMRQFLQVKTGQEFNGNYCPVVIDALVEKLTVTGFEAGAQSAQLWQWWEASRMDGIQDVVHRSAVRDGDTYLIVEYDNEKEQPAFIDELAYNGHEGVKVHYSKESRRTIEFASKRWQIDHGDDAGYRRRLNLYYPNRIEKYISDSRMDEGNWQRYQAEDDPAWPLWWTRDGAEFGEPLGVPVIHFKNSDQGYNYGKSEIRSVIPLQDALNKSIIDLVAAADTTGFRIFFMIGDDPSALTVVPGTWIYTLRPPGGPNGAQIGHIPGEDLSSLIKVIDKFTLLIAHVSRTPVSMFQITNQRAAEGTQKQEESGLVNKARKRHIYFGNAWEDAMAMARKLHNVFGPGPELDENQIISTVWGDPEVRNEKEHIETIALKKEKLGIPLEVAWAEAGYSPEQIEEMKQSEEYQARLNLLRTGMVGPGQQPGQPETNQDDQRQEEEEEGGDN